MVHGLTRRWSYLPSRDNRTGRDCIVEIISIQPIVALIAGVLILVIPRLLNIIVALYLIFIGLTGLFPDALARLAG